MDTKITITIGDLPAELFHKVLEQLGCEDRETLAACSLVCRRWFDISRQHLFSDIHVPRDCDETFEDLATFVELHETTAGYVRTLNLEARLFHIPPVISLMPSLPLDLLFRILRALPNLTILRMRQIKIAPSDPSDVSRLHRFNLEHMEYQKCLSEIGHTFELLSWFHIDHFDFDPLFSDSTETEIKAGDYALDVRSLCVSPWTTDPRLTFQVLQQVVPRYMLKSFRYPSLTILSTPIPVVDFLREVGQNIIDLNLCPSGQDDYLVLPQLPSLKVFRYHLEISLFCRPADLSLQRAVFASFKESWLPHLPMDLEQLIMYLTYPEVEDGIVPAANTSALWGLESALARFPRLKKLSLIFPELPCDMKTAISAAAVCFPTHYNRGVLEVDVRDFALECRDFDIYGYLRECC
ncbi:hypothetical protein BD309DRAFT_974936 [Dichomitus squalens]|uniref:Uncharacterized protein n=2 Tax=Dichomitus squalens TaxID=114155 RepID=A0A4Q9PB21_9APHY|nr:uncharacterized protein DICSQDRAFT_182871 [Dichomitus squalens LYAD-421 SS1]EJF57934.1 hypothetical protein DICSQDRAFT_182871 [Dichomitus squalens LYAD-421 SS1]TBU36952.1 hypothetical protein BD309DRAFT_974936 [Dichomitus squalens]TBU51175.1 hypothetical protein BD310DRAFT_942620 [Dichomitus squalens]